MVRVLILVAVAALAACTNAFVMKAKSTGKPVMVGDIRQIGGEKKPHGANQPYAFSTEITVLDTPTTPSFDWELKESGKLDDKLAAATLLGERDAQIAELKFGSYVFFPVLFYFDKDWLRLSGFTEPLNFPVPERKYHLFDPAPRYSKFRKDNRRRQTRPRARRTQRRRR